MPDRQCVSDFLTIRNMIAGQAPEILVHVVSLGQKIQKNFFDIISDKPTLVFSPMPIQVHHLRRGSIICPPDNIDKFDEISLLHEKNIPTPKSFFVKNQKDIQKIEIEDECIIKPLKGSRGRGVNLISTHNLKIWSENDFLESNSNNNGMIVQKFIDTGEKPSKYRVLTVLGKAIYSTRSQAGNILNIKNLNDEKYGVPAGDTSGNYTVSLTNDDEVIEFAEYVHNKLKISPVMGIDIIRENSTDQLYVNELNPCGWTWHLSSKRGLMKQRLFGNSYYKQFNALEIITEQLIENVRKNAV